MNFVPKKCFITGLFSILVSATLLANKAVAASAILTAPARNGSNWINQTNTDFSQTFSLLSGQFAVMNSSPLLSFGYGGTFPSNVGGFPTTLKITLCSSSGGCADVTPVAGQSGSNVPVSRLLGTSAQATFTLTTRLSTSSGSRQSIAGITANQQSLQVIYGDGVPTVSNLTASTTSSGATFDTLLAANRYATSGYFRYGKTSAACSALPSVTPSVDLIPADAYDFRINKLVKPLASGVRYFFCAVASNSQGTTFGSVNSVVIPFPNYSALFSYGQSNFPQYFPPGDGAVNQVSAPYTYRFYPSTQNYLGVCTATTPGACPPQPNGSPVPTNGRSVYVMGPAGVVFGAPSTSTPIYVGEVESFGNF